MPLTRGGWLLVAGATVTAAAGRLLGILELTLLGIGGVALTVLAVALTLRSSTSITVQRVLGSGRVVAGEQVDVRITVEHRGRRPTPELELIDHVGRRQAHLLAPPLRPGAACEATYALPTTRRGRLTLGPVEVVAADPFGLSRRREVRPVTAEVVVVPRTVLLAALPRVPVEDTGGSSAGPRRVTSAAGEFHSLRPYVRGDDLRMVHWPTAMRTGNLVVRQNEQLWDAVTTVVLDDRRGAHRGDDFEAAVTAAASVAAAAHRSGARFRVVTPGGLDSGLAGGAAHLDRVLHHLALVEMVDGARWTSLSEVVDRRRAGAVALVVGSLDARAAAAVRALLAGLASAVIISTDPRSAPAVATVPVVPAGSGLVEAWPRALERLRTARMAG